MKKTIFSFIALSVLVVSFSACKKKKEEAPVTTGSATVEGYIKINSNLRNDTLPNGNPFTVREGIPTTVTLTFIIDSYDLDLNPDNNYNYQLIQKTTTVDASGKYSITVPTPIGSHAINGQLKINDFEYNPIITSSQNTDSLAARVVVPGATLNYTVFNGSKTILDHNY